MVWTPNSTVAAIIHRNGRYLMVKERSSAGQLVLNQPAGHIEPKESIVDAVRRETLEETGYAFTPQHILGIYLSENPHTGKAYLRIAFVGEVSDDPVTQQIDNDIEEALWLTKEEILSNTHTLRSQMVKSAILDHQSDIYYPLDMIKPLQQL